MKAEDYIAKQFMIEHLTHQLIVLLMEDQGLDMRDAMDVVYNSNTFKKVENANTGLYYQSPVYVLDMLYEEVNSEALS